MLRTNQVDSFLNILIAGAQKAATSSLFTYLSSHPSVVGSYGTECTYYSDPDEYRRGSAWALRRYFPDCSPARCSHEHLGKNVDVLPDIAAHSRAAGDNPALQVICVLRDPVQRAYSAFRWAAARGIDQSSTFGEALEKYGLRSIDGRPTHGNYLRNGCYASQLKQLAQTFPREQIHAVYYEDIIRGVDWVPGLLHDLGLSPATLRTAAKVNVSHRSRSMMASRVLAHHGSARRTIGEVLPVKVRSAIIKGLWRANTRPVDAPPMPKGEREFLTRYYEPFDDELARYYGRALPWR
jgi:hypothetical protein